MQITQIRLLNLTKQSKQYNEKRKEQWYTLKILQNTIGHLEKGFTPQQSNITKMNLSYQPNLCLDREEPCKDQSKNNFLSKETRPCSLVDIDFHFS